MVKRIGNLLLFIFCFSTLVVADPSVRLEVTDLQGAPLKQAGMGVPFAMNVVVENSDRNDHVKLSDIAGLDGWQATSRGSFQNYYTSNGAETLSRVEYRYSVRVDEKGQYLIGPAKVVIGDNQHESAVVSVEVGDKQVVEQMQVKKQKAFVRLHVEKKKIFVGQGFDFSITLYMIPGSQLDSIELPKLTNVDANDFEKVGAGKKEVDGVLYEYWQWRAKLFAKRAGPLVLPAVQASVLVESNGNKTNPFFRNFFGPALDRRQIVSDALQLTVEPLPAYEGFVNAVGSFESFSLDVDQMHAKEGEGIVATIAIKGQGNLKKLKAPTLQLSDQLRSYESKSSLDLKRGVKLFEYIVQATDSGELEIPAQMFTFFDPEKKEYKSLHSSPIKLAITPVRHVTKRSEQMHDKQGEQKNVVENSNEQEIAPLSLFGPWYPVVERHMSDGWFTFFVLLPFLWLLLMVIIAVGRRYRVRHAREIKRKKAFKLARRAIELHEQQQDVAALYRLFISLIAARAKIDESAVSVSFIEQYFEQAKLDEHKMDQWQQFFDALAQARFFSKQEAGQPLFARSRYWIIELEKRL